MSYASEELQFLPGHFFACITGQVFRVKPEFQSKEYIGSVCYVTNNQGAVIGIPQREAPVAQE